MLCRQSKVRSFLPPPSSQTVWFCYWDHMVLRRPQQCYSINTLNTQMYLLFYNWSLILYHILYYPYGGKKTLLLQIKQSYLALWQWSAPWPGWKVQVHSINTAIATSCIVGNCGISFPLYQHLGFVTQNGVHIACYFTSINSNELLYWERWLVILLAMLPLSCALKRLCSFTGGKRPSPVEVNLYVTVFDKDRACNCNPKRPSLHASKVMHSAK